MDGITEAPAALTVTVDIDHLLGRIVDHGEDGEPIWAGLRSEVVHNLAAWIKKDIENEITAQVRGIVESQATAIITETIAAGVQKTNSWGEPSGQTTSLRDEIVRITNETLTKKSGGYGNEKTLVTNVIQAEVDRALTKELTEAVREAKAKVVKAVTDNAAAVITQTITDLAKGR